MKSRCGKGMKTRHGLSNPPTLYNRRLAMLSPAVAG